VAGYGPRAFASSISIDNVSVVEGDSGVTSLIFTITLSLACIHTVTVHYATSDKTAQVGSDYIAIPETVMTFNPGETSKTINVEILGDTDVEPDEYFYVDLSNAVDASLVEGHSHGLGTILNDD
jgi:hypothetical protein